MKKIQLFIILLSMGISTQSAIAQRHGTCQTERKKGVSQNTQTITSQQQAYHGGFEHILH